MSRTNLIIKTVNSEFKAPCSKADFDMVVAAMQATGQVLFIHLPEKLIPNTYIVKSQMVSVSLEEESEQTIREKVIEIENNPDKYAAFDTSELLKDTLKKVKKAK